MLMGVPWSLALLIMVSGLCNGCLAVAFVLRTLEVKYLVERLRQYESNYVAFWKRHH